jgi:hypothetical protein
MDGGVRIDLGEGKLKPDSTMGLGNASHLHFIASDCHWQPCLLTVVSCIG